MTFCMHNYYHKKFITKIKNNEKYKLIEIFKLISKKLEIDFGLKFL